MESRAAPHDRPAAGLPEALHQTLMQRGQLRSFAAQTVLVHEGDESEAFYLLLEGRVKVYGATADGRELVYNTLGPGEFFGELSLDGGARSASVACLDACRCVLLRGSEMRALLRSEPDFAWHLLCHLVGLLRRSTDAQKSLALDDVYGRVVRLLQDLARPDEQGRLVVPMRLTQQDIAERVGCSREMISRIFKQLSQGGYLDHQRGRLELLKPRLPASW